jgi:hypothetical protein
MRVRTHIRNNVVGYVALFLVLCGGVAYANDGPLAGQNTVGSADIINGEVYGQDILAGSIGTGKVADDSLTASDLALDSVGFGELDFHSFDPSDIATSCVRPIGCAFGIPPNAIQTGEIQDGPVHKPDLAADAAPDGYSSFDDDTGIICNAPCQEGSLPNIPAGAYAIFGKIHVDQPEPEDDRLSVGCRLHAGADFDDAKVSLMGPPPGGDFGAGTLDLRADTLNMQVVHTFTTDGGKAFINCRDLDIGNARGWDLKITAIRLGSLSNVQSDSGPDS